MSPNAHIPAYLLTERFAAGKTVLDIYPNDPRGTALLAQNSRHTTIVHQHRAVPYDQPSDKVTSIRAKLSQLPFVPGAFDLVLALQLDMDRADFDLKTTVDRLARCVNDRGLLAIRLPNKETPYPPLNHPNRFPDFLQLERMLRHHFPHLSIFAQQPLFGAILSPLGRRQREEGPLLDDRMLPDQGEPPNYFVAICARRYQRFDDTIIAQLPFEPVAEAHRREIEQRDGTIRLISTEKENRDRKIAQLEETNTKLTDDLAATQAIGEEMALLQSRLTALTDEVSRKDQLIEQARAQCAETVAQYAKREARFLAIEQSLRKKEQQMAELERSRQAALLELEEQQKSQVVLLDQVRELQAALRKNQRDADERLEQLAEKESELATRNDQLETLRNDLSKLREEHQMLAISARTSAQNDQMVATLEKEVERLQNQLIQHRERLSDQMAQEHHKLLDIQTEKDQLGRALEDAKLRIDQLQQATVAAEESRRTTEQTHEQLAAQLEQLQNERRSWQQKKRAMATEIAEAQSQTDAATDELKRQEHAAALLRSQIDELTDRNDALEQKIVDLQTALQDAETQTREQAQLRKQLAILNDREATLTKQNSVLQAELLAARNQSRGAAFTEKAFGELENQYEEALCQLRALKSEKSTLETRMMEMEVKLLRHQQLEERTKAAFEQIERLQNEVETLRAKALTGNRNNAVIDELEAALSAERQAAKEAKEKLVEANDRISQMASALGAAKENLTNTEKSAEAQIHNAAEKIKELMAEIDRLKDENETELLLVREDLEVELKEAFHQLDDANQEIWELREEVVRLGAQSVATAAAATEEGINKNFQQTLLEQETFIHRLGEERKKLKAENDAFRRSLEIRKKNMKILASILRREHHEHLLTKSGLKQSGAAAPKMSDLDIRALLALHGGDISGDEVAFLDGIAEESPASEDDAIVDAIMESVVRNPHHDKSEDTEIITIDDDSTE